MRYLSTIAMTLPVFVYILVWGVSGGLPVAALCAVLFAAFVAGVLLGSAMSRAIVANVLHGQNSVFGRRFPGGFGFVIAVGLIGGFAAALLLRLPNGHLLLRGAAAGFATLAAVTFSIVGLRVLRLERAYGRRVYMWPDGIFFDEHTRD